jgi:hypothetical protein
MPDGSPGAYKKMKCCTTWLSSKINVKANQSTAWEKLIVGLKWSSVCLVQSVNCNCNTSNLFWFSSLKTCSKWVSVIMAWHDLRKQMEERSLLWNAAVNILNKQSTVNKGWYSSLGVGNSANDSSPQKVSTLWNFHEYLGFWLNLLYSFACVKRGVSTEGGT